jgi:hypothetical protein
MYRTRAVSLVLACLVSFGLGASPASAAKKVAPHPRITNCDKFQAWFAQEPAHYATAHTLSNYEHFPSILHHGHESLSFNGEPNKSVSVVNPENKLMLRTRSQFGGGGCLSGFYDKTHHIIGLMSMYDTAVEWLVFHPHVRPSGLPNYNLAHASTQRGAHLGMTFKQLTTLEGPGRKRHVGKILFVRYSANGNAPRGSGPTGWITFMLEHNRVTAIDYFWGS